MTKLFRGCAAVVLATATLAATETRAQSLSPGCSQINSGFLDQGLPPGGIGTTKNLSTNFFAGDVIDVTITNAQNSLFVLAPGTTVFSGDTGTQSRSVTVTTTGLILVSADIIAIATSAASIAATCTAALVPPSTPPTTPPAIPPTTSPPSTTSAQDVPIIARAGVDAVDTGRLPSRPGDLPSRFNPPQVRLPDLRSQSLSGNIETNNQLIADLREELDRIEGVEFPTLRLAGTSDTDAMSIRFGRSRLFQEVAENKTSSITQQLLAEDIADWIVAERTAAGLAGKTPAARRATRANADAIGENYAAKLAQLAFLLAQRARTGGSVTDATALPGARFLIEPSGNAQPTPRLSFDGSGENVLQLSTQGMPVGDDAWFWTQLSASRLNGDASREGRVFNFRAGLVKAIDETTDIGMYLGYIKGTTSQVSPNAETESEGYGLGLYMKTDLGNGLRGGLSLYGERTDNDIDTGGVTGTFERRYSAIYADISRAYQQGVWTFEPGLTFGWTRSKMDGFTDSSGTTHAADEETRTLAVLDLTVGRRVDVDMPSVATLDLSSRFSMGYAFDALPDRSYSNGSTLKNEDLTGAIDLGATIGFVSGGRLDLRMGLSGLGGHTQATSGSVTFNKSF